MRVDGVGNPGVDYRRPGLQFLTSAAKASVVQGSLASTLRNRIEAVTVLMNDQYKVNRQYLVAATGKRF
jgi:predicted  nucleic acid-binding Zn-ribbon protein